MKLIILLIFLLLDTATFAQDEIDELFSEEDQAFLESDDDLGTESEGDFDFGDEDESALSELEDDFFDPEESAEPEVEDDLDLVDLDDLDELREDIEKTRKMKKGDELSLKKKSNLNAKSKNLIPTREKMSKAKPVDNLSDGPVVFDVGAEEKELLRLSKFVEGKIPENQWNELSESSKLEKYVVKKGDWLWKISQRFFGSGFYYAKIWSLNPQITNPHEIEPGMTLLFETGDSENFPSVSVGKFRTASKGGVDEGGDEFIDLSDFGETSMPAWLSERERLKKNGAFFQFGSEETYEDLAALGKKSLENEYDKYEPPANDIEIEEPPSDIYDNTGFDKSSIVNLNFKEGFFLNTFVTTNIVQDFGSINSAIKENIILQHENRIFVDFDELAKVKPGDKFSVYKAEGVVKQKVSDREGYRYTIIGQIEALKKNGDYWECIILEQSGLVVRGDRITVYTPKIDKITRSFSNRRVEAAIMSSFLGRTVMGFGDVVYLDRGRADGMELGNILQVYSSLDRQTGKLINPDPTYKVGELVVISITDNFSTALVTNSSQELLLGALAITKSPEEAALATQLKNQKYLDELTQLKTETLDELDVELQLDDLSKDILKQADQLKLTEDELAELERQEREKSIIRDHEKDLRALERLEKEIEDAEGLINESKLDEDKFLEDQDLNEMESGKKGQNPNAFESLNEIEKDMGRKYMDEDLNAKENPYGLTDYDIEEIDELLNLDNL